MMLEGDPSRLTFMAFPFQIYDSRCYNTLIQSWRRSPSLSWSTPPPKLDGPSKLLKTKGGNWAEAVEDHAQHAARKEEKKRRKKGQVFFSSKSQITETRDLPASSQYRKVTLAPNQCRPCSRWRLTPWLLSGF